MAKYLYLILAGLVLAFGFYLVSSKQIGTESIKHIEGAWETKTIENHAFAQVKMTLNNLMNDPFIDKSVTHKKKDGTEVDVEIVRELMGPFNVSATAEINDKTWTASVEAIAKSIFKNAWLIDNMKPENKISGIHLDNGVNIDGPIYVNDYLRVANGITFTGSVHSMEEIDQGIGDAPIFMKSHDFDSNKLPLEEDFSHIKENTDKFYRVNRNAEIIFNEDKKVEINNRSLDIDDIDNQMIYVSGDVNVSGIVSGELAIYATGDVTIIGDLTYLNSDLNMLTIISENDIILNYPDTEILNVNANLYALGSLIVDQPVASNEEEEVIVENEGYVNINPNASKTNNTLEITTVDGNLLDRWDLKNVSDSDLDENGVYWTGYATHIIVRSKSNDNYGVINGIELDSKQRKFEISDTVFVQVVRKGSGMGNWYLIFGPGNTNNQNQNEQKYTINITGAIIQKYMTPTNGDLFGSFPDWKFSLNIKYDGRLDKIAPIGMAPSAFLISKWK